MRLLNKDAIMLCTKLVTVSLNCSARLHGCGISGAWVRHCEHNMKKVFCFMYLLMVCVLLSEPALAKSKSAAIVVDAKTGVVLDAQHAEALRHPASLTKLMTLYLTFKALKSGTLRMNEAIPISEFAASQPPSKLGLQPGTTIRVRDAILGLITQSANDAAVVLAEAIGGSQDNFARQMTRQARRLSMNRTVYRNASGLPDDDQVSTARDQAILARALLFNFPDYYPLFHTTRFTYRGITHDNHNHLMRRYPGMDGMKTGYIRASGFNLVASAVRGKTRLIGVVFGGNTARARDRDMANLLNKSFAWVARNGNKLKGRKLVPMSPANKPDSSPEDKTAPTATPVAVAKPAVIVATAATRGPSSQGAAPNAPTQIAEGDGADEEAAETAAEAANRPPAPTPFAPTAPEAKADAAPVTAPPSQPRADAAVFPTKQPAQAQSGGLTPPRAKVSTWTVQVGSFRNRTLSEQAVQKLGPQLPKHLAKTRYEIVEVTSGGVTMYRARLVGLDEKGARSICRSLTKASRKKCSLIPPAS